MNIHIVYLVKLQRLDTIIDQLRRAEKEGPEKIAALDLELAEAEQKVADGLELEKTQKKRRREIEAEAEQLEEKVKTNTARQYQIKTNEEYRAMLRENEYLKKNKTTAEDEILKLMESLEALEAENKTLAARLEEERAVISVRRREIEEWVGFAKEDLAKKLVEREALVKGIPREMLAAYNRVYKRGNGRAVVPIIDGICQECHLQIPPQHFNELRRNDKLMVCVNCNRIIYWSDHEDFQNI